MKADRNEVPTKERFFDFDVTVSHLNDTTSDGRNSSEPVEVGSLSTTIYRVFLHSQVVQDFFQRQYGNVRPVCKKMKIP